MKSQFTNLRYIIISLAVVLFVGLYFTSDKVQATFIYTPYDVPYEVVTTPPNTYTLTVNTAGNGSGTTTGGGTTHSAGATATATASPNGDSNFSGWSGDCSSGGTVFMDSNKTCVATFTLKTYTVTPIAGSGGTISPNTQQVVNHGSTVSFTATPTNPTYTASVSGCGIVSSSNPYVTAPISSNCTVNASFSQMAGTLNPASSNCTILNGGNSCTSGTLTWTTTNPVYTSEVTNNGGATPSNPSGNNSSSTFTVPYSASGVSFYLYNNSQLLATAVVNTVCESGTSWNGSICTSSGVAPGPVTNFVATPGACGTGTINLSWSAPNSPAGTPPLQPYLMYRHPGWIQTYYDTGTSTSVSGLASGSSWTFYIRVGNSYGTSDYVTASATAPSDCSVMSGTLSVTSGAPGTCPIASGSSTCNANFTWTTTNPERTSAVTSQGSTLFNGNNGTNQTSSVPYGTYLYFLYNNMVELAQQYFTADCVAGADWISALGQCRTRPTITAIQASNGTISPAGTTTISYGSSQPYTINADPGFYVSSLIIDGATIAGSTAYTFSNVTNNHTISATFASSSCTNGATNPPTCNVCTSGSELIGGTCTPVTVSVSATTPYNVAPSSTVSFYYSPYTNWGTTHCRLLDNVQSPLTGYPSSNPVSYTAPSGVGSYAYYIQCRNTTYTGVTGISNQIIVNTSCPSGTTWDGGSCIAPPTPTLTVTPSTTCGSGTINLSWTSSPGADNYLLLDNGVQAYYGSGTSFSHTGLLAGSSHTYIIRAGNSYYASSYSNPITVNAPSSCAPPTVNVTASPSSVSYGGSSTISWTSINATSCDMGGLSGSFGTGALTSSATYYVYCNGPGGTSYGSATVSVAGMPAGNLTIGTCSIPPGSNTCSSNFTWTTTNPIGTSAVTSNEHSPTTLFTGNNGTNQPKNVPYGTSTYYLYNGGYLLDQETINIDCQPGSGWMSSLGMCVLPPTVNVTATPSSISYGASSTISWTSTNATSCYSPYTGSTATSASFSTGPLYSNTTYTVSCSGPGGTSSDSVTVVVAGMPSGTLSITSCTIASGESTCNGSFTWTTTNPIGTSAITSPSFYGDVFTGNNGTNQSHSIPYGSSTYYLYNGGYLLDQETVVASCTSGTSWTGSMCAGLPTVVTTNPITSITQTTATGGGTISSNGGSPVTVSGITWSLYVNPTTALSTKTTNGWAIGGPWSSGMTGLSPNTLYYVRAYATNSVGTSYGSNVTFTTSAYSDLVASDPSTTTATGGVSTNFSTTISNINSISSGSSFPNIFQFDSDANHTSINDTVETSYVGPIGGFGSTGASVNYTFPVPGAPTTWYVRACADLNLSFNSSIIEANEGNNCSNWTSVLVSPPMPIPVVSISASPTAGTVNIINPALTWGATNSPTSCTASGDWSGNQPVVGNSVYQGVLTQVRIYTYTLTCSNAGGTSAPASVMVVADNIIDGVCSSTHYSCFSGISTDNVEESDSWTWSCVSPNGGNNVSCTEFPVEPQCSDTLDNDSDGVRDEFDPGCHTDGVVDPDDPNITYNPNDDKEDNIKIEVHEN